MNDRLDGRLTYTDEDEDLQDRIRSLAQARPENSNSLARVGAEFLRVRRDELE